jgi:DNA repair exonuclease SbcCD ATPase subunit
MMAMVVATTSSFVSCKDTVGDDNALTTEKLYQQDAYMKNVLLVQIQNLKAQVDAIKQCHCETPFLQKYAELLDNLDALVAWLQDPTQQTTGPLQALTDWIDDVNQALADLEAQVQINKDSIYTLNGQIVVIDGKIVKIENQVATNKDSIAILAGLIAQNANDINGLAGRVTINEGNIASLVTSVTNLTNQLTDLAAQVAQNKADIATNKDAIAVNAGKIAALEATMATVNTVISTIQTDLNDLKAKVEVLEGKFDNYYTKAEIDVMKQDIENKFSNYFTKEEMNTLLNAIDEKFNGYYTKDQVDGFITEVKNMFNNYYDKTKIDELLNDINAKFANYYDKAEIDAKLKEINDKFADYYNKVTIDEMLTNIRAEFAKYYTAEKVDELMKSMKDDIEDQLQKIRDSFNNYYTKAETDEKLGALEKALNDAKAEIDGRLTALEDKVVKLNEDLSKANEEIATIKETYATKAELQEKVEQLQKEIADAQKAAQDYAKELVDALEKTMTEKLTAIEDKLTVIDGKLTVIDGRLDGIDSKLTVIDGKIDAMNTTIGEIQNDIKDLQAEDAAIKERLTTAEEKIATLEGKVATLEEQVDKIFKAMNLQVTGIIVQGAYSPVFGIGNLPIGVQTNILAAYYGAKISSAVKFPANESTNYVEESEMFTLEEMGIIGGVAAVEGFVNIPANTTIFDEESDDNAGTLYVTVNPNTVDFTGKVLSLENSQGKAAPVSLSPLAKSDYRVNFGWTRAADNGFYEAKAKLKKADLENAKARIELDQLKSIAKDVYHNHSKNSIAAAASALYTTVSDVLDANAVKATYTGLDDNGNEVQKSVFSEYGIAATAIKPLSFNTLHNWNPTSIPGLSRVESFANRIINKFDLKINLGFKKVVMPEIKEIKIVELNEDLKGKFLITYNAYIDTTLSKPEDPIIVTIPPVSATVPGTEVTIDEIVVKDADGNVIGKSESKTVTIDPKDIKTTSTGVAIGAIPLQMHVSATYDLRDELQMLYDNLSAPVKDVNTMLADLKTFMEDVNDMLDNLSNLDNKINGKIEETKDKIRNAIREYLDRFENAILSRASYVNEALQPVLLAKGTKNYNRLSKIEKRPSNAEGCKEISLIATTYNVELLSPAYKKFLVCTGAWKSDGTFDAAEAKAANKAGGENFGKVINGSELKATFKGKAGYTYRIVYQALDYHGKIASGRYYVKF